MRAVHSCPGFLAPHRTGPLSRYYKGVKRSVFRYLIVCEIYTPREGRTYKVVGSTFFRCNAVRAVDMLRRALP